MLRYLRLEKRTPSNAPYYGLRFVLFVLPAIAIWGLGSLIVSRGVALTVAGAFLSVQLIGPYARVRRCIIRSLKDAREEGRTIWRWSRVQSTSMTPFLVCRS